MEEEDPEPANEVPVDVEAVDPVEVAPLGRLLPHPQEFLLREKWRWHVRKVFNKKTVHKMHPDKRETSGEFQVLEQKYGGPEAFE